MIYYLYKITNTINGKIYIGVHQTDDINDGYMGSGKLIKRAIEKYGIESFTKDILGKYNTPEEMYGAESLVVDSEFIKRPDTYNLTEGGRGGFNYLNISGNNMNGHDYDTISKMGVDKRRWLIENDPEHREQCIKHLSDNRPKATNALKEKYKDGGWVFSGKTHTKSAKDKIGKANSTHQTGSGNSQYGTMWIHNLELKQSKRIPKNDPIPDGWIRGRKIKFNS